MSKRADGGPQAERSRPIRASANQLAGYRLIAFDLPGFGLSDAFDYTGRSLRG